MPPEVSVIVPNYNHAPYLKQRLDSILEQTYQDFELIILDDKSLDGSGLIIDEYRTNPKVSTIVYNHQNSGSPFAQWEKGLKMAKGKWIWIAESDDYADPLFLETLLAIANHYENVGIAFSNSHWVDNHSEVKENLSIYTESFYRTGPDEIRSGMCNHCTIQNVSSTILKKEYALQAVEDLSKFKACGDWIFYTRILHQSNIAYTGQKLNYFRWYHPSVSTFGKKTLWVTEGIQVLENIDYRTVKFSFRNFTTVAHRWARKALRLKLRDSMPAWLSLTKAWFGFLRFNYTQPR